MKTKDIVDVFREMVREQEPILTIEPGWEGDASIPCGGRSVDSLTLHTPKVTFHIEDWWEDGLAIPTQFCMYLYRDGLSLMVRCSLIHVFTNRSQSKWTRVAEYALDTIG